MRADRPTLNNLEKGIVKRQFASMAEDLRRHQKTVYDLLGEAEQYDMHRHFGGAGADAQQRLKHKIDDIEEQLADILDALAERAMVYCEHLGLNGTRDRLSDWVGRWPPGKRGETKEYHTDEADGRSAPAFNELSRIIEALLTLLRPRAIRIDPVERRHRELLEYSLRSLAKVCYERKVTPRKEHDIQDVMHSHLAAVFADYTQQITLAKPLVSFRPDGGVPSLRAAIECKFVSSQRDVATAIHGLTEDLSGYSGTRDWRHFYSVVYLT